jgi:hypothetical protein
VDLSNLKQPQLDPWVMWWMRPYLVPGKAEKEPPKTTTKPNLPAPKLASHPPAGPSKPGGSSVTLSPRFSRMGGNALNDDVTLGFTLDLWPVQKVGIEFNLSAFPMAGSDNTKTLATAVLSLLPPQDRLESNDRVMAFTTSLITAPFAGTLAPPGAPPIYIEFLLGIGGGLEIDDVEMLSCPTCNQGNPTAEIANAFDSPTGERYLRPIANLLIGSRIFPIPNLGFRTDLRLMGGPLTVLNYDDDSAREANRNLASAQGGNPLLNRLSCHTNEDAVCKIGFESSLTIEFGIDISLGAPRGGARR